MTNEMEVERLLNLPMDEFRDEVDADVRPPRRKDPGWNEKEWSARHYALRSPALADRWFMALSMMAKNVDGQLAAKQEDYEANKASIRATLISATDPQEVSRLQRQLEMLKRDHARSRAGTLRFKNGLDERIIEARACRDALRDSLYDSVVAEERNRYAARVLELEDAIREHRAQFDVKDLEPDTHDVELWTMLE